MNDAPRSSPGLAPSSPPPGGRDQGTVHITYGSPGTGKTRFYCDKVVPQHIGPRRFVVYATAEADDASRFRWGPVVRDVRELDNKPCPEAVCVLGDRGQAIELALRVRKALGYRVALGIDEAHEEFPEPSPKSAIERFHTWRHRSGLRIDLISQWPARLSKVVFRTALAVGSVRFFRIDTRQDGEWMRDNLGAAGALRVAELPEYESILIEAGRVPPEFREWVERLRREVERGR